MKRCLLPKLSLLLIIFSTSFCLKAQPTVLTSDSLALVDLYNSTNGASWTDKTNWLTGPVNTWFGVTVVANRVTEITFNANNVTGSLPAAIGNLTGLTFLQIKGNPILRGSIPAEISNLGALVTLDLSNNQLSGSILNLSLPNLQTLNLSSNQLNGAVASNLPITLTSINFNGNGLSVLPDLTSLTNLVLLDARNNNFTFEDLEPNIGIPGILYNSQYGFGFGSNLPVGVSVGMPINLSFTVGGSANIYQWKLGAVNVGINSNVYNVASATITDAGTYTLTVTNSLVPGLTLTSAGQIVSVKQEGLFEWVSGGELTNEGFDVTGNSNGPYAGQWGDFNNDGLEDIFMTGFNVARSYLYKNNGNGTFSKLPGNAYYYSNGRSITWGDYNNDGFLDAFAPDYSTDSVAFTSIFKNNGNETFTRIQLPSSHIAAGVWLDADNDGDLDLVYHDAAISSTLYRNDGNDTFTPITGVFTTYTSWNPVAVDINNDGRMDLFFPSSQTQSSSLTRALYINNGNNTFALNSTSPLVTDILATDRGASFADIDNDGDYDALIVNNTEDRFYINDGAGNFTPQTSIAVLGESIKQGRGSAFADYNNDGYVDLIIFAGPPYTSWLLFTNNKNGTFTKETTQNFRAASAFNGASFGDYNNDGFLDIVTASFGLDNNGLYRNKGNSNNWLQLKLVGNLSNKSAVGAKVDVYSPGLRTHQQILTNNGAHNQNSLTAQFGLGSNTAIDSVIINWPSGLRQKLTGLEINRRWSIKENNFEVDSLALVALYNAMGGPSWTTKTNWLTGDVTTWAGVTFTGGSVTAINLPNNNLVGKVPEEFANLIKLQTVDLSNNKITTIPDLTSIQDLTAVNVSANALNFSSLEKNASLVGFNYGNQAGLGVFTQTLVDVGSDYDIKVNGGGPSDEYQWKRNGAVLNAANAKTYTIPAINRSNMGDYTCEITNPTTPGLTLLTAVQRVLATATLQGRLLIDANDPATVGTMTLLKVNTIGAFDTTAVRTINNNGTYLIEKVILDDYLLAGFASPQVHTNALPTYFTKTIFWEEADTLVIEGNLNNLDIISEFKPTDPENGVGVILGFFEEDDAGGRTEKNKRVSNSGASLRRVEQAGRAAEVIYTLIAHTFTNEDGEFVFSKLDPALYRLNLQYPGYPMDTTSYIDIEVGSGLFDKEIGVEARVINNKIVVTKRLITGWETPESPYTVYPNPVKETIRISSAVASLQDLSMVMYSSTGQVVSVPMEYNAEDKAWIVTVGKLPRGIYFIKMTEDKTTRNLRVVISD